jgi:hypothetical protein
MSKRCMCVWGGNDDILVQYIGRKEKRKEGTYTVYSKS